MIVKRNLSPVQVARYTRGPMLWATACAAGIPAAYAVTGWSALLLPFAPVGSMVAALAIFVAFRNNTSFGRWNEARASWQSVLVASRVLARQIVASADAAVDSGTIERATAQPMVSAMVRRLIATAHCAAGLLRGRPDWEGVGRYLDPAELADVSASASPVDRLVLHEARQIKEAIRQGLLGQFDPIAMEPQLAAISSAVGAMERISSTPTPRQYDFFTRRFVELLALVMPMGVLSLMPDSPWAAGVFALLISSMFIMMAVTGAANDEPFAGFVTDVPVASIVREVERDLLDLLGADDVPARLEPVDGYLW